MAVILTISTSCRQDKSAAPAAPSAKTYTVRGEVVSLDPKNHTATLRHERIDGWMEAMTMEFPVKDPEQYAKLAVGDRVNATLYVNDLEYYLAKVEVTAKATAR